MFRRTPKNLGSVSRLKPDEIELNCDKAQNYAECAKRYKPRNHVSDVPEQDAVRYEYSELMKKISMEKDENVKIVLVKLDQIQRSFILYKGRSSTIRGSSDKVMLTNMKETFNKLKNELDNLNIVGKVSDVLRPDIEAKKATEIAKINEEIRLIDDAIRVIDAQPKVLGGRKTKRTKRKKTRRK